MEPTTGTSKINTFSPYNKIQLSSFTRRLRQNKLKIICTNKLMYKGGIQLKMTHETFSMKICMLITRKLLKDEGEVTRKYY